MKKLYKNTALLDRQLIDSFKLDENILMEHAANSINLYIRGRFKKRSNILIIVASGNNGADGFALSRLLHKDYRVKVLMLLPPKTNMAKLQKSRCDVLGVKFTNKIPKKCDVVVDCLFGSGLNRIFSQDVVDFIQNINNIKAFKIACDIPSGIDENGDISKVCFKADITFSMGAFKLALFSDKAKDFVGKIEVVDLGVSKRVFESKTCFYLLKYRDMKLPYRKSSDVNKGSFGHLCIFGGDKMGACVLASKSAFNFGVGLVSLLSKKGLSIVIPPHIMISKGIPKKTTALLVGCGMGSFFSDDELNILMEYNIPMVLDADIFYKDIFLKLLKNRNVIITPHPREFVHILKVCGICDIDVKTLQKNRFDYALTFSSKYKNITLLLKGANQIIANKNRLYINSYGANALAKGGSGDVLSGLVASLLSQGYPPLDATITASLALTKVASKVKKSSFGLTPQDLIKKVAYL